MKINAFTKTYAGRRVLSVSGLEIEPGKIYAVIGANGSGKSTLAKIIAGIEKADEKGSVIEEKTGDIGYMPQKSFAFHMKVINNVLVSCDKTEENRKKAMSYIERLELNELAEKRADKLSGGETAKTALARILMRDWSILILDEPTAAMDVKSTITAEEILREYRDRTGAAIIMVTHSLKQALRVSDKAIFLYEGQIWETGDSTEMLTSPKKVETQHFIEFYGV